MINRSSDSHKIQLHGTVCLITVHGKCEAGTVIEQLRIVCRYEAAAHVVELEANTQTRRDLLCQARDLGGFRNHPGLPQAGLSPPRST